MPARLQRLRFHLRYARALFRKFSLEVNNNLLGIVQRLGGINGLIFMRFLRNSSEKKARVDKMQYHVQVF